MIVILVPFFLAAQFRDSGWPLQGAPAEVTYSFTVNSTAVSATVIHHNEHDRSTRFDMSAQVKCRFRGPASLICRMTDSRAVSFASSNIDPSIPAEPLTDTVIEEHPEYQISEEAFEITFTPNGIGKILVNRTVSPADLNIIRAVVNQFNIGANIAKKRETQFRHMEKSIIGKCDTAYHVVKNPSGDIDWTVPWEDDYKLSGLESLGRKRGETMRLDKWRNVHKCSLRADYFFGSRESLRTDPADFEARIEASESSVYVSDINFASYTFNELRINRQRGEDLTIYENYSLTLVSIDPAESKQPTSIVDPASASIYAYQYIDDDEESAELHKRYRAAKTSNANTAAATAA